MATPLSNEQKHRLASLLHELEQGDEAAQSILLKSARAQALLSGQTVPHLLAGAIVGKQHKALSALLRHGLSPDTDISAATGGIPLPDESRPPYFENYPASPLSLAIEMRDRQALMLLLDSQANPFAEHTLHRTDPLEGVNFYRASRAAKQAKMGEEPVVRLVRLENEMLQALERDRPAIAELPESNPKRPKRRLVVIEEQGEPSPGDGLPPMPRQQPTPKTPPRP